MTRESHKGENNETFQHSNENENQSQMYFYYVVAVYNHVHVTICLVHRYFSGNSSQWTWRCKNRTDHTINL
ncbi:hypothetical protein DSECCO2_616330 [anaerobic digester metagenome]